MKKLGFRIGTIILAVLILLSAYFVNFVEVKMETTDELAELFKTLSKDAAEGAAVYEDISIKRAVDIAQGKDDLSPAFNTSSPIYWSPELQVLNSRLITVGVSFAVMILLALFLIVFSICSKNRLVPLIAGAVGIIADIVMIVAFRSAATDVYTGKVDLTAYLLDKFLGTGVITNLLGSIAGSAVKFVFSLCGLQNAFLFLFLAVILWAAINYLVDLGDPKAKAEKEAEKAEKAKKKEAKKAAKAAKAEA
ncbi:MAG: hypothetical protein IK097_02805 [Clostridia bacterium]|nr:hypothetical protein [Clostridia bacterium]